MAENAPRTRSRARTASSLFACLLLALALCRPGCAQPTQDPEGRTETPNFLLITLDTTRADHLGCYGSRAARTPTLDGLAREGALFEEAHSHVPLTLPSHAVMLTGDLPSTLNLRVNGLVLRKGTITLATILKAKGYWTGAVLASVILDRSRGLSVGFDLYDDRMTHSNKPGVPPEERRAEDVTTAALKAIEGVKGPYFLWVHYYDPHYEYRAPEPYATTFAKSPYDGEIAYMDSAIGRLLSGLRQSGLLGNTLVAAAGDHGEGLWEHGERQHGTFLYEYAIHVPLLMAWEGRIRPGIRLPQLCGLMDLAPTALDLLGVKAPDHMDGESLRPLLEGRSLSPRPIYIESYHGFFTYGWAPLRGILTDQWKYIQAPKPELYRWRASEEKNLYRSNDPRTKEAVTALKNYPEPDQGEKAAVENISKDSSNAETVRQLISLGYLSGGGARRDDPRLLDPKDAIGIEEDLFKAKEQFDAGQSDEGTAALLSVLRRNPENLPALSMLGTAYLNAGRYDKAKACFDEEIRLKPQMETAHLNLGTVYKKTGRLGEAAREYRFALAISPRMSEAVANLAQVLLAQNHVSEARTLLESALADHVESADVYFETGVLEAAAKNWDRARFAFSKTIAMDPRRDEAMANLGNVSFQQGLLDEAIAQYERAARIAPRNASYLATLGSLYLNGKGDFAQALTYYRRAVAADPYGPKAKDLQDLIRNLQAAPAK